jgi:3-oxoacyl-[acyl-carrier protein] reductase
MALLSGKTALVTGGTQGIGYAIAEAFLKEGAVVAITGRDQAKSEAAAAKLAAATGGTCLGFGADVSKSAEVDALFEKLLASQKKIDVLVNNAGITKDGLIMRMSEADFDDVIATNLKGSFLCCKASTRPMLKAKGGAIINIGSIVGVTGNAGQVNYSASKAGLVGLTKSLAKELASRGIRVNVVAPGFIATPMTDDLTPEAKQALMDTIPLAQFGQPADIAAACLYLAADSGRYVTGQVLRVDGGMNM